MAQETERRFLVRGQHWRTEAKKEIGYRQGYLSTDPERSVRIRAGGGHAAITIKGKRSGLTRSEFEYSIPVEDANTLLEELCLKPVIYKNRFTITANGDTWEVDEYENENKGLVVAELEQRKNGHRFSKPDWAGDEISEDDRYSNVNLVRHPYRMWRAGEAGETKFHLKRSESIPDGLSRTLHEQLDNAIGELSDGRHPIDEAVHEARKCLKKTRSVLRMTQSVLGRTYREANRKLRDIGRKLSELRDAEILEQTIDRLKEHEPPKAVQAALDRSRAAIMKHKNEVRTKFEKGDELTRIVQELRQMRNEAAAWPLEQATRNVLTAGIEETVRRGRESMARALDDPTDENFHECRKRAKDMRYQLEFLRKLWPDVLSGYAEAAKELEQDLGDDHDLSVLRAIIMSRNGSHKNDAKLVTPLIESGQKKLRKNAAATGHILYSEKPRQWAARLERCWAEWG